MNFKASWSIFSIKYCWSTSEGISSASKFKSALLDPMIGVKSSEGWILLEKNVRGNFYFLRLSRISPRASSRALVDNLSCFLKFSMSSA